MSGKGYFETERRVRKRQLLELIKKTPNISQDKMKGIFSLQNGLTFRRIEEYLRELEAAGLVATADDGTVKAVE